jgi:hypothetical protein
MIRPARLSYLRRKPPQIEAWQSNGPSGRRAVGVYKLKAAKFAIHVEFVCNFQSSPTSSWRSDGPCSTRQLLRLFCKLAVEFWQDPKEPIQIPDNYFGEVFALIFAKWHYAPMHVCYLLFRLELFAFASDVTNWRFQIQISVFKSAARRSLWCGCYLPAPAPRVFRCCFAGRMDSGAGLDCRGRSAHH